MQEDEWAVWVCDAVSWRGELSDMRGMEVGRSWTLDI